MVSNIEKPANRRQSLLKRFKALLFAPWFLRMMFWIVGRTRYRGEKEFTHSNTLPLAKSYKM